MDEPVYFRGSDARRIERSVVAVENTILAGRPQRKAQNLAPQDSDEGGNTSGPCGCCNCLDCVDLCRAAATDVITDCSNCPNGALKKYKAAVGYWLEYPDLTDAGEVTLTWDADCVWKSDTYTTGGGTYRWELTQAQSVTALQLVHVSGADPLVLLGGYWQVIWRSTQTSDEWSCLCNMSMRIQTPERVPKAAGLNCTICLSPLPTVDALPLTCSPVDGVIPCVEPLEFPGLAFLSSDPAEFPYGFDGNTAVTIPLGITFDMDRPCLWAGTVLIPTTANGPASIAATLYYPDAEGHTLFLSFRCERGSTFRYYSMDPGDLVLGDNTLTVQPLPPSIADDSSLVTWPSTLIMTLSDCIYGSTHADYGYGCGGTTGGGCGGQGCVYTAIDSNGIQGGPTGPWTWSTCGGCPDGCTMPAAPGSPSSGSDTYAVSCEGEATEGGGGGTGGGSSGGSSGTANNVYGATPAGTVDGSNDTFTLGYTPVSGTVQLFLNGVLQDRGDDYTISGATITFGADSIPQTGDKLRATYVRM